MSEISTLLAAAKSNGHDVWVAGPVAAHAISKLESAIGIPLPKTLTAFLAECGAIGIGDCFLSGIVGDDPLAIESGNIYGDTMIMREEFPDFPPELWVLLRHDDGAFCLDSGRSTDNGQYAIVNYEIGSIQHDRPLTWDYNDFVLRWFLSPWTEQSA